MRTGGLARICRWAAWWTGALLYVLLSPNGSPAQPATRDASKADTSRAARENAALTIPLEKLTAEGRAKVSWVLGHTSIFRRLPVRIIQSDPDLYQFVVEHPDVIVNIWQVLGVSHLTMQQTGPDTFKVVDDIGTSGWIEYLYRSRDTHVLYVDGTYTGSMFGRRIHGRGVLVLKTGYTRETDGRSYITSRLDAFMNVEPDGMEFLTKTFQPVVGRIADANFQQTAGFVACLSRTAEANNLGMQRLAAKLTKVQPGVRQQFAQISDLVTQRARSTSTPAGAAPAPEAPLPPRTAERPVETGTR